MSPAALYFASGDSLYPGAALLMLAVISAPLVRHRWLGLLRSMALWLGLAMMVMASPPVSWWMLVIFVVALFSWLITSSRDRQAASTVLHKTTTTILVSLLLLLSASELFHRRLPVIKGNPTDHLVIVGDSLSAGIDPRFPSWPVVLQQKTGIAVKNLSQAGAGVIRAQILAATVIPQDNLVLIEIGGNDLLSGLLSDDFNLGLEALLRRLVTPGRTLVMFELPLLPHRTAYGRIQRRLAKEYGVFLIPKRCFAGVLSGADATSDGLHLSAIGAERMASLVQRVISPVLKTRPVYP